MGYLTYYTFGKLCKQFEIKQEVDLNLFLSHVYKDEEIFFIFNKFELKYLFNYKNILENEDQYYTKYYQHIPEKTDQKNYVFEKGGKTKYHLSNTCAFISKDFVDFVIPSEIKNLGDEVVLEYREWFKTKGYAEQFFNHKLDQTKVVFDYNMLFPRKYQVALLNDGFKLIEEKPNSSHLRTTEFNHAAFLIHLEHLKNKYRNVFSCKVTRILSKFDSLLNKSDIEIRAKIKELFSPEFVDNYGLENLKDKLRASRSLKMELMKELLNFFKWTFNLKDKNFNNVTLENFGLACCGHCISKGLGD